MNPIYAALSYVWGGVSGLRLRNGSYNELTTVSLDRRRSKIPNTVLDAIEPADEMGLKYIWVDALCLIQDDRGDKELLLPPMHLV